MKCGSDRRVKVYRNLAQARLGIDSWSVMQGGYICGDASFGVVLRDAVLYVSPGGWKRVLSQGKRNAHAWGHGFLVNDFSPSSTRDALRKLGPPAGYAYYSPFAVKSPNFVGCKPGRDKWCPGPLADFTPKTAPAIDTERVFAHLALVFTPNPRFNPSEKVGLKNLRSTTIVAYWEGS